MPSICTNLVDVYVFRRTPTGVELLLLKRAPRQRLAGTWQAVHGKVESGETAWQTALRELREETGLKPRGFWQLECLNTFYMAATDNVMICPCFAAEAPSGAEVRLCNEHTDFRWAPIEQAIGELMWPGQRHAVRELVENILARSTAEPHLRIDIP